MQGETESANPHAPLPPVTTRWRSPESRLDDSSSSLAPPYLPGADPTQPRINPAPSLSARPAHEPRPAPVFEPPVVPMFDSTPAEAESQTEPTPAEGSAPASEIEASASPVTPLASPVAIPEQPRYDEPMPWEEYALLEAAQAAAAEAAAADAASEDAALDGAEPEPDLIEADRTGDVGALDDWERSLEAEGGVAVPAWGDEEAAEEVALGPPPRLDDEGTVIPDEAPESSAADQSFPLDAFIIPPHAKRLPKGLEHAEAVQGEIAEELAYRLDAMASRLRSEGFPGLLVLDADHRPVDTLLAGVLAGYLAHEAEALDADAPQ